MVITCQGIEARDLTVTEAIMARMEILSQELHCIQSVRFAKEEGILLLIVFTGILKVIHHISTLSVKYVGKRVILH